MVTTKAIKKKLKAKEKKPVAITEDMLLSTGSTTLNCACTGNPKGGLVKGHYYLVVGTSASGKTVMVLSMLAEAAQNVNFDNYELIYDPIEGGALFNMRTFFGRKLARRLTTPARGVSETVEDVYFNIDDAYLNWEKTGRPFIYIVDSMDGLTTKDDESHFQKTKTAKRAGTEAKGSYGATKAKFNSTSLRRLMTPLKKSGSILVIICQTRASFSMFASETRSGGHSLKFYATLEIWLKRFKRLTKTFRGQKVPIGNISKMQVKKNRVKGKDRSVLVPIYDQFKGGGGGIDDVGACVDYLVKWKHWKKAGGKITAPEFDFVGTRDKLISAIDFDDASEKLQTLVGVVWNDIENECAVARKPRYV